MSKFMIELRTGKHGRYALFGFVAEYKRPQLDYMNEATRTTLAFIRPHKVQEGIAVRLWGYDKLSSLKLEGANGSRK